MACVTGAQGQPLLEWQVSSAPAVKPVGYSTTFTGWEATSPYRAKYGPAVVAEAMQTREESGRDWWQAHCNLADGGYVTAGYTSYVNWLPDDGCPKPTGTYPAYKDGIATYFMEREDRRQSATRQAMARYDAMGTLVWYKTFAMGAFSDVVQDHEGNLVAAGSSMDLMATADVPVHSIYFNPAAGSPATTVAQYQCTPDRQRKMSVMKLDGDGNILWDHLYHHEDNILDALEKKSEAHGLIETFLNGTYGYRVVGYGAQNTGNGTPWRLFVVDLDSDGLVEGKTLHTAGVPGSVDAEDNATIGWRIVRTPMGVGEYYAIVGSRILEATERSSAFAWVTHGDQSLFFVDTKESAAIAAGHNAALDQNANGACFQVVDGTPFLIWPVLADFTTDGTTRGYTFVGNHQARGSVYKLDMQGDPVASWDQPVDLGVLRGFDLHLVATPTSDGHVALASTKWSPGYDAQNPFGWEDLPSTVQEYLDVSPQGMHFDANGPDPALGGWFNWEHFRWVSDPDDPMALPVLQIDMNSIDHAYGYWNTDSYVAKVDGATGDLLWEKQWDEGTGALATGWPGNFRRRQCMFDITEAPDRGLVVCGNEGSNFDDAYIAKLKEPCGFEVSAQVSYACPGDPEHPVNAISLTVNGAGSHAFSWSNGATTPAITDLLPGTYFVLVTDDDGCTTTEGYTIYEPLTLGYVAHPACMDPDGDALLEVVAIGGSGDANMSYTWWDSYTIGGYIVGDGHTWNLSNPPHLPYPPYIYVATSLVAQDMITGCTITESVDVSTGPAPPQPVTSVHIEPADCHAGTFGSIALQLDPDFAPYHVEWSNGAVTQNVFELEGGSYSVTITYGHACTNTYSYTVPDNNTCCTADIVIPDGAYSSDYASPLNTTFSNTSLKITGTFHVDNNCFVNFSIIYMDPGAEIIVEPGAMFVVRDSEVEDCMGRMWKSILANGGSYLEMQRNTVKDAEYAVTALDGASVLLFNNDITDNRVGLYVPNTAGVTFNSVSAHVIGNRFKSTGTLALPYPGQTTAIGNVGFAAVLAYNTALDLTGYSGWNNLVDGMSNGIIGHNSDLSVAQFNFKNIQPDAAYILMPVDANGSGIVAIGGSSDQNLKQVGNGKEAQPSFQNCKWGIYTRAMNTSSRDNNMQAMGTGYRVDRARASTSITNNRVVAKRDGMVFNQNAGTANFWVKDNDITFGSPSFTMPISQYSGIVVADAHEGGADSRIEDNKIFHTANTNAHAGISLLAAKQWTVAGNQITMAHNALNRYGIANYGSSRLEVSCNTVTGAGTDYVQGQAAIYSNMGDRLNFTCNSLDLTTNGFLFNGAAQYVNLAGTSFRRHKWALHLSTNAIIGAQERRGNLWYNAPAAGGWGALYEVTGPSDPNPALNPFTYNPAIISGGNTEPPSWSPSEWFQPDYSGANFNCQSGFADGYCGPGIIKEPYPPVVKRTGLDSLVAADGLQNDPYTEESKWMLKGGLYGKLDDDPELRYEYQDMADFWDGLQGSATATFKMVEDGRATLYDLDSTVAAQIVANRDQIEALLDSSKVRMGQLQDSTLAPAQRTAALAALAGFREGIRTLNAWNEVAMETARTTKVLTAEGIQTANAAIGTSRLIEENTKQVNDIWLATVAKEVDTLSTAQAATLLAIADQCPMLGGNAVYAARALYRQVNDTLAWDDQLLCLPHGIIVKSVQQEDVATLTIVPNPARDNATLVLDRPLEQPGMLKVLDMTGKEVLRLDIPEGELRTEFAIGALASGLYQYRVVSGSILIGHGKLAVTR